VNQLFGTTLLDICARVLDPLSAKLYDCGFMESATIRVGCLCGWRNCKRI